VSLRLVRLACYVQRPFVGVTPSHVRPAAETERISEA
jgi:hypothetical protein